MNHFGICFHHTYPLPAPHTINLQSYPVICPTGLSYVKPKCLGLKKQGSSSSRCAVCCEAHGGAWGHMGRMGAHGGTWGHMGANGGAWGAWGHMGAHVGHMWDTWGHMGGTWGHMGDTWGTWGRMGLGLHGLEETDMGEGSSPTYVATQELERRRSSHLIHSCQPLSLLVPKRWVATRGRS